VVQGPDCADEVSYDFRAEARAWTLLGATQLTLFRGFGQAGDAGASAIERALALNPDLGEAHALRARQLYGSGNREEAFAELAVALRLDPESYFVNYRAGTISYEDRRFADAARYLGKATKLSEGDFSSPAQAQSALQALGDLDGARAMARVTLDRSEKALVQDRTNGAAMANGASALAALGQRERAREWIGRAMLVDPDNENMRYNFACTLSLYLQDVEAALDLLEPLLTRKQNPAAFLRVARSDPDLDPIRDDPRFQAKITAATARLEVQPEADTGSPESA
jgi:adenylate cyclase